jgi:hypothetical protein
MNKQFFVGLLLAVVLLSNCKKDAGSTNGGGDSTNVTNCNKLIFFRFADNPNPWFFEYNAKGKLLKTRWFPNRLYAPVTKIFQYDVDGHLTKIYDSLAATNTYTAFTGYNAKGDALKATEISDGKKIMELEFFYDAKTGYINKKVFQFFDMKEIPVPVKDTMLIYYDPVTSNVIKETAITNFNGIRREYILLEAEGYDNKTSFYKSLGNEFNYLYRWNRGGEGFLNQGFYLFSPTANNPGKVYLHNQNITDNNNKGDYITYTYQYNANGYPEKFTHTYTTQAGTKPGGNNTISYNCK